MEHMRAKSRYELDKTKLKNLRKSRKMTLDEAANIIGVAKAQLHQWEVSGALTVRSLLRISAAFGVNPKIFFVKSVFQPRTREDIQR